MSPLISLVISFQATATTRRLRLLACLCIGFASCTFAVAEAAEDRPVFEYLVDEQGEKTLGEIQKSANSAFQKSGRTGVTLSFIKGAVWLRFSPPIDSDPDTTWLLQFADPLLDDIRVYQELSSGQWLESRLG